MPDGYATAHVPPRVGKRLPPWPGAVWQEARQALTAADRWVVAACSAPLHDALARKLLVASVAARRVADIDVSSRPNHTSTWKAAAPAAAVRDRGPIGQAVGPAECEWSCSAQRESSGGGSTGSP